MALQNDIPSVRKGDWNRLKITIDKLRHIALGRGASPTFANLNLTEIGANDPCILFTSATNSIKMCLDESATYDYLHIAGQTAATDTLVCVEAVAGRTARFHLGVGVEALRTQFTMGAGGNFVLRNMVEDGDIILGIDDGGVDKTITWDGATDTLIHSIGIFNFGGKVTYGSFTSPTDVTNTREYGLELHYSGNNYNATAIRARAHAVTTDTSAQFQGGLFQAANNDNINVGCLNGLVAEAIGKATTNAATITMMRGALVGAEWSAKDTVTDLRTLHVRTHTRDAATEGYISGTGHGIMIENEAVGGNGQALDAGIYFKGTNLSAGNKAFTYGIDFTGATYGTAEIKLLSGSVIGSDKITLQPTTDSTTFFQVLDADGGTSVFNVDTTNERVGIRTDTPEWPLHIKGELISNIGRGFYIDTTDLGDVRNIPFAVEYTHSYTNLIGGGASTGFVLTNKDTTNNNFVSFSTAISGGNFFGGIVISQCLEHSALVGQKTDWIFVNSDGGGSSRTETMKIKWNGNVGIGESAPETLTEWTSTVPYLTLHNSTHEDTDGGRESRINFKGEQGVDPFEETTLVRIEASHDGTGADDKGKLVISINDGNDGDTPTQALEIGSDLLATFAGGGLFGDDVDISGELDVTGDSAFGPVSPTALTRLSISKHVTITSAGDVSNRKGIHASVQVGKTGLADYTGVVIGISTQVQLDDLNTQDWTNANAIRGFNADINTESSSAGTVVGICGYSVSANIQDAARVTNFYGYKVGTIQSFGGKLGNAYGVHIADMTAGDTLNYAIYTGAGLVHLGDDVDVDGNADVTGVYKVDSTQVVSNRGAAVADAIDAATTMARLNDLLARCRAHGLIAT